MIKSIKGELWILEDYALIPDGNLVLDWGKLLPESIGSKDDRLKLVESFKSYFLAMSGHIYRSKKYAPTTLHREFSDIKILSNWMAKSDIWKISDITPINVIDFLAARKSRSHQIYPAKKTIEHWICMFKKMWILKNKYSGAIGFNIEKIEDQIYESVRGRNVNKWRALPDNVAYAFIFDAFLWVENHSEFCINFLRKQREHLDLISDMPKYIQRRKSKIFYQEISSDEKYNELVLLIKTRSSPFNMLLLIISMLEGACLMLILLLVGMRISELLALDADCLDESQSDNGLYYLVGPAAKKGGITRKWVIGLPIAKVIKKIIELKNIRDGASTKALFSCSPKKNAATSKDGYVVRMQHWHALRRIRYFCGSGIRNNAIQYDKFHPHMARKTFAQLAVKRDRTMLAPISAHLGHIYQSFTDGNYIGVDHSLAELLSSADRAELIKSIEHLLTCGSIVGKGADSISKIRDDLRFKGKRALISTIEDLIKKGIKIAPCDWGFCLYSQVYSACEGNSTGPNEVKRSPDTCATCKNFVVTENHHLWWEQRAAREEKFLNRKDLPLQTVELVKRRLLKTKNVLGDIVWLKTTVTHQK